LKSTLVAQLFIMHSKTQVLIVGAGPTGLSLATQFIRQHVDFIIIDKNETTTTFSKALVVHARTMEIFNELGLADKAKARGARIHHLNMIRKGKQVAQVNISGLGEGLSEFPFVLSLEQSKTEKLLHDFLTENKKEVKWNSDFMNLVEREDSVLATYADKDGQTQTIEAQYLVGCDGAHSPVRHQLNLSFEGETESKLFYVADVLVDSTVITEKEFYFLLANETIVLFFGMEGEHHFRIIGMIPPEMQTGEEIKFGDIAETIKKEAGCELKFTDLRWFSTYKVSSRKANAFSSERCFICGDSAHIHTPAGGQGMNTGIQDAYNLAWKMSMVLKNQAKDEILKTYSDERTENAAHLIKTTDRMFELMAGSNFFLDFFRQHIFPVIANELSEIAFAKKKLFPILSQIGIAYPHSPLTIESSVGNIHAGDRMPYCIIENKSVFDFLKEPVYKILTFGKAKIEKDFSSRTKIPYELHSFEKIPEQISSRTAACYILLRPDNHISYIGSDLSMCYKYLDKISC
jgi:2-polyprenyl-6-methoxyphenol hydroxylase-like FAD-dependent oxidoreductase